LVTAFVLTVALKLHLYREPAPADLGALGEALGAFLLQHGFETRSEKRFDWIIVHANAGKCRMLISEAAPQGWDRNRLEMWAKPVGRRNYIFDGAVHSREPFLAPMLDEYWARVRVRVGLSSLWISSR